MSLEVILVFIRKLVPLLLMCFLLVACANNSVSNDEIKKLSFQVFLPEYLPDGFTEQKKVLDLKEESLLISYVNGDKYIEVLQVKRSGYDYHQMIQWYASKDNTEKIDNQFEIVGNYVISIDDLLKKQGVLDVVLLPKQHLDNNVKYDELNYYHVQTNFNKEDELKSFIESLKAKN
ncbi:hypothetical protein [Brevibacillus borstelensis]|uniref:hypothetical protein n=1 Tax=Brevibacillus borstelensis TaxID=45462 RepID=UPI0030BC02CC